MAGVNERPNADEIKEAAKARAAEHSSYVSKALGDRTALEGGKEESDAAKRGVQRGSVKGY